MKKSMPSGTFYSLMSKLQILQVVKKVVPRPMLRYLRKLIQPPAHRITIVSFYTPGGYYEEMADALRARCDELGMLHDIQPITFAEGTSWSEICRAKVRFYRKMLFKHQSTIMWLDVDTTLLRNVDNLAGQNFDMAMFMRGFRFLPQDNIALYTRRFHPGYIIMNYTRETREFLYECKRVEQSMSGDFTDDYILEEAFRRTTARPRLLLLSSNDIARPQDVTKPGAYFLHGNSGNVDIFKGKVLKHQPDVLRPESQKAVLLDLIKDAAKKGERALVCTYYNAILLRNPKDFHSYNRLLEISAKFDDPVVLEANIELHRNNKHLFPYALKFLLLQALDRTDWKEADRLLYHITVAKNNVVTSSARSRMFRASLDRRAEVMGLAIVNRVKLFWWEQPYPGNLGDILSPYIVEKVTGIPPQWAGPGEGLCAIGSVIKYAKASTPVWGSGTPNSRDTLAPHAAYHSVRGPLTRDLVIRSGGTCPEVYGDPAWLLPILYPRRAKPTHKIGLILHFTHEQMSTPVAHDVKRIDIRRIGYSEIEEFLDELLDCEQIISSSLHGVIIAQAYGIPACLATVTTSAAQIHGDGIKFDDYYRSIGYEGAPEKLDLSNPLSVSYDSISAEKFLLARTPINLPTLLDAAPFDIRDEVLNDARCWLEKWPSAHN